MHKYPRKGYSAVRFSFDPAFQRRFDEVLEKLDRISETLPNYGLLHSQLARIKRQAESDMDYGLTTLEQFGKLHYTEFREANLDFARFLRTSINNLINSYR